VAKCPPVGAHPGITGRDHRVTVVVVARDKFRDTRHISHWYHVVSCRLATANVYVITTSRSVAEAARNTPPGIVAGLETYARDSGVQKNAVSPKRSVLAASQFPPLGVGVSTPTHPARWIAFTAAFDTPQIRADRRMAALKDFMAHRQPNPYSLPSVRLNSADQGYLQHDLPFCRKPVFSPISPGRAQTVDTRHLAPVLRWNSSIGTVARATLSVRKTQ
jgi:hypothetical protein